MRQLIKWTMPLVLIGAVAMAEEVTIDEARSTVASFKQRDPALEDLFSSSVGYVIFPQVTKGAFVVGGAGSEGILFEHGVPMGTVSLTQVTVGAQVGGQKYSELIFIKDRPALYRMKRGEGSLSAEASAAAAGREGMAAPRWDNGLRVYTLPIGGLMAEASVGGQKFDYHPYATPPRS